MTGTTRCGCLPRSLRGVMRRVADQKNEERAAELLLSRRAKSQNSQAARPGPVGPASDSRAPASGSSNTRAHAVALEQFAVSAWARDCLCVPFSLTEHLGGL